MTTTDPALAARNAARPVYTIIGQLGDDVNHFLLVDEATLQGHAPLRPLYVAELRDPTHARAFGQWLYARHASWQAWGELAATHGHAALVAELDALIAVDPLPPFPEAFMVERVGDDAIALIGLYAPSFGLQATELWRGRYPTQAKRDRVYRWLRHEAVVPMWRDFADYALAHGSEQTQELIDGSYRKTARSLSRRGR